MDDSIALQYVGFETKGALREYVFSRREAAGKSSRYFVTIANEAFAAQRARYQDAPAICSIRLRRELATGVNHPPSATFPVTDAELADYKNTHPAKAENASSRSRSKPDF